MKVNEGILDRIIRVVLGGILMYLGFFGSWHFIFGIIGLIPLITGIVGFCPLYALLNVKTKQ
jgi:hypothetical protein